MVDTTSRHDATDTPAAGTSSRPPQGAQIHHGRTWAAWTGSMIAMATTIAGGIAVMMQNWVLFWIAAAVMVLGLIATKVLQVLGHGAD